MLRISPYLLVLSTYERMEELVKKKDEGKKRSRRRGMNGCVRTENKAHGRDLCCV